MKKENLVGQKFGRLIVISLGRPIFEGKNKIKKTTWNCSCECGNVILAKSYHLKNGGVTSCGCYRDERKIKLKSNQKFGKLTTISYNGDSLWLCLCECGNTHIVKTDKLINNKTKSCGCLQKISSSQNIKKAINSRKIYEPYIASARRIWQIYCAKDGYNSKNALISFEDFYLTSQQNCYYCGIKPNNNFNLFKYKYTKASLQSIANGNFIYNKLSKIDNNRPYIKNNCVAWCNSCKIIK